MTEPARKVPPEVVWRVARNTLGRMACEVMDPADKDHDHDACVRDPESYAADLLLGLVANAANANEDGVLEQLTRLMAAMEQE